MVAADFSTFHTDSIRFFYPSNWTAQVEDSVDGVSVSLQSQGVSFAVIGLYSSEQEPADLVEQTIGALREEHPSLDAEELLQDDPRSDEVEMELSFLSMDVVVQCWLRSWRLGEHTVLVLMQSVDREADRCNAVYRAICHSIQPIN